MKHLSFISLMLLSLSTFAQNTTYVQPIDAAVHKVNADNRCTVTIVADTVDYVMVKPEADFASDSTFAHLIRISQHQISFSDEAMFYSIEVHLSTDRLDLYAEENSTIVYKSNIGDTVRLQSFSAYATDLSEITVLPFVKVENTIKLHYDDLAQIIHNGYSAGFDIIQNNSYHTAVDYYAKQDNTSKSETTKLNRYRYSFDERSHFSFLWGWNNWGSSPLNGLLSVPGGSELKTTFTSYQLNATFAFIARKHCEMSIGIGYESDKYNFRNAFVQIEDGDFVVSANPGNWINDVITRYVNIPVQFTYFSEADHDDAFGIGLAIVPGFGIAAKTKGYFVPDPNQSPDAHVSEQTLHINRYLNPVKCDVRVSFFFSGLSFFIQPSLLPVFNNGFIDSGRDLWKRELIPFKMGFSIGL